MTLIGFIRHGRTAWNEEKRIQGHTDISLNERGRSEMAARRVPDELTNARWYVSPLSRTAETARLLGIKGATPEPRLKEMSFGEWEGRTLNDLRNADPDGMSENELKGLDFRAPGGESPREVQQRLLSWLPEVTSHDSVGAVTHNGVIRAAMALALDWDMTGKPPVKLQWMSAHLFRLDTDGRLLPVAFNVPLPEKDG